MELEADFFLIGKASTFGRARLSRAVCCIVARGGSTGSRLTGPIESRGARSTFQMRLPLVDWMQHLQWPAMAATLLSAWLVAAQSKGQRQWGFWIFLLSNLLWAAWGWHDHAWALIILQFGLAVLNLRGVAKNERA